MERKAKLDGRAIGLMVLLCALWGVQQVAAKVASAGISPLLQAGIRSVIALILVGAWAALRRIPLDLRDGTLLPGMAAGVLFAGEFALLYWGLSFTSASRAVLFLYTSPFIVAAGVHWLVPGEALSRWQVAGLVAAFAGMAMAFADNLSVPDSHQLIGDLLCFGAAVLWGATTVTIRVSRLASTTATKTLIYQLAVSSLLLLPASLVVGESGVHDPTPLIWLALAYQSVVVAFATYLAWFWLITRYPAGRLSAFGFLTPLFGMLSGALLLGETITPLLALAMLLVTAGLWMVNHAPAMGVTDQVEPQKADI